MRDECGRWELRWSCYWMQACKHGDMQREAGGRAVAIHELRRRNRDIVEQLHTWMISLLIINNGCWPPGCSSTKRQHKAGRWYLCIASPHTSAPREIDSLDGACGSLPLYENIKFIYAFINGFEPVKIVELFDATVWYGKVVKLAVGDISSTENTSSSMSCCFPCTNQSSLNSKCYVSWITFETC